MSEEAEIETLDTLLDKVEAMFDCGAAKAMDLAKYLDVPPQRIWGWVRQRKPKPSGETALKIQAWAAGVSTAISTNRGLQRAYREAFAAVQQKRKREN